MKASDSNLPPSVASASAAGNACTTSTAYSERGSARRFEQRETPRWPPCRAASCTRYPNPHPRTQITSTNAETGSATRSRRRTPPRTQNRLAPADTYSARHPAERRTAPHRARATRIRIRARKSQARTQKRAARRAVPAELPRERRTD
ncbi:hypothetical protein ET475_02260 [Microbacterium protaetiae]|uniref:Uncharacterized protein n=1 Tax=Microbacterium protaetiae TaxID=2509458 RepID=A0A4P6EA61_9MICO|nr:hypothetical protein ET475_02260 [Microbacterium protaetiae]